jgi:ABC-2 type transport system permease protein
MVAVREVVVRVRARSFRVTLAITVGAVVLGIFVPHQLQSTPGPYRVEIVGDVPAPSIDAIRAAGSAAGREVVIERADRASALAALRAERADLVYDGERLTVRQLPSSGDTGVRSQFLATARESLRVYTGLYASGLSPDEAQAALSHPAVAIDGLVPPRDDRTTQKAITTIGIVLIFIFIQQYSSWVINGVIEEKSSRVVEVLLSVVKPNELLIGKTIGIGIVAIGHGMVVAAAALLTSLAIGGSVLEGGGTVIILGMVGWFLLAYALYCLLNAMAGSLVSRQEEAQNAAFPFMMPLLIGYISSVSTVFSDDPPTFVKVLSFIPLTAPVSMPARMAAGPVPLAQVAIAVGGMLLTIVFVARLASVVYARGVLQTSRLRWKDVLTVPGSARSTR